VVWEPDRQERPRQQAMESGGEHVWLSLQQASLLSLHIADGKHHVFSKFSCKVPFFFVKRKYAW